MTSRYFDLKTATKKFEDDFFWALGEISGKRIVLYGDIEIYNKLKNKFHLDKLNVVAASKFEFANALPASYGNFKAISPYEIQNFDFDSILVLSEDPISDKEFLCLDANLGNREIKFVFNSLLPKEYDLCNYLEDINFSRNLDKLSTKFYGKTIVIYGAGKLFDVINKYYDLSKLNIVGICDERFENHYDGDIYSGYKVLNIDEVKKLAPDCVLVATREYISVMEILISYLLKDTGILIKPLARKSFFAVLKDIWK